MAVSPATARDLTSELFLMGRAIRTAVAHPDDGRLLPGGIAVLVALEDAGPTRQVDLAARLCISASALSRHVAELVTAGYLGRRSDPADGRATLLQITDEGRDLLRGVRTARAHRLQAALADWDEAEAAQACVVVGRLRDALTAHIRTDPHRVTTADQAEEVGNR